MGITGHERSSAARVCEFGVDRVAKTARIHDGFERYFPSVHKNSWRSLHVKRPGALSIFCNSSCHYIRVDVSLKPLHIESDFFCVTVEYRSSIKRFVPGLLIVVKLMMHVPKLSL